MSDLIDLAARVTQALPEGIGTRMGWHLGQHASRKTRIARLRSGGRVAADVGDHLHRHMFFRGEYEPGVTRFMRSVANPGWSVVDVGANVGYFSVLAADLGGPGTRVIAFEPHPRLAGMLTLTARHNAADISVEVAACGRDAGVARLFVSPEDRNSGLGSLRSDLHDTESIEVSVLRVDDCCREHDLRPDFVKIDAEGFELEVLGGCGDLLERRIPRHFLIELSPQRDDPEPLIALLAGHGYAASQIRSDGSLQTIGKIAYAYEDICFRRV